MDKPFENTLDKQSLKEFFFYAPPHDEDDEEDTIVGYIAAVRDYQTKKTKYIDGDGNVCDSKSQAKVFNTKGKADNYSYEYCPEGWTHFAVALKKSDILSEAITTKYMACCYDPEDYYEETNYVDEDGELRCNSSGAKLFDTEDEAIEYADDNRPYGWVSFAMPARCESTLKETVEDVIEGAWFYNQKTKDFITVPNGDESTHQEFFIENANLFFSKAEIDKFCRICKIKDLQELCSDSEFPGEYGFKFDTYLEMLTKKGWIKVRSNERNTFITCYEINRDTDGIFDLIETHPEIFLEGRLEKRIHIEGIENVQFITSTKKYVEKDLINFEDFKG